MAVKVRRVLGVAIAVMLVLCIAVVLILRLQPSWALAVVNTFAPVRVEAQALALTLVPLRVSASQLDVSGAGFVARSTDLEAQVNWQALWYDLPFWSVAVRDTRVTTESAPSDSPQEGASQSLRIPAALLQFTRLYVERLEIDGAHQLSVDAARVDERIDLEYRYAHQATTVKGEGSVTPVERILRLALTNDLAGENWQAEIGLRGDFSQGESLSLTFTDSEIVFTNEDVRTQLAGLNGAIAYTPDQDRLGLAELSAMLSVELGTRADAPGVTQPATDDADPGAVASDAQSESGGEPSDAANLSKPSGPRGGDPLSLDGEITALSQAPQVMLTLGLGETDAQIDARLNEVGGHFEIALESQDLPDYIPLAGYHAQQLLPLQLSLDLQLDQDTVQLEKLVVDAPALDFVAEGTFRSMPLQLTARVDAERLSAPVWVDSEDDSQDNAPSTPAVDAELAPLFADTPIDWQWLADAEVDIDVEADSLNIQAAQFRDFALGVKAADSGSGLVVEPLRGSLGDGGFTGSGQLLLDAAGDVDAELSFALQGVRLEQFGFVPTEELSGGAVLFKADLSAAGNSAAQLAGSTQGEVLGLLEDATLANDFIEIIGSDFFMEILSKLNPFHREDPSTELECAVIHLKAQEGVFESEHDLAVETTKMDITGQARLALVSEDLDVTFTPSAREGFGVNVGSLVKFVKLGGTLREPSPEVDALGVLQSGAAVGAALSTGGVSILAEGLAKRALNAGSACSRFNQESTQVPAEAG